MNIFFSQLFQRLYEFGDANGGALPIPMFLVLDEFANIGRIPNFERILSTCRSKKLHISIILQSIDQLEEIYDEKVTQTIMANCSTQLFLGSNAQKTLETFSKLLGEKTISHDNVSRNTDKDNKTSGHGYSDQILGRALMTPDELRRLDTDECIIFIQTMKPIKAKKYWYYPKKLWSFLFLKKHLKPHPLYYEAKNSEISHLSLEDQKRGDFVISDPSTWLVDKEDNLDDIWNLTSEDFETTKDDNKSSKENKDIVNDGGSSSDNNQNQPNSSSDVPAEYDYDLMEEIDRRFAELFGKNDSSSN